MERHKKSPTVVASRLFAFGAVFALMAAGLIADDRDMLRKSAGKPFVFIVMDTSGSMNWTPPCSHKDAASDVDPYDGMCTSICPMKEETCQQVCPNLGCGNYADKVDLTAPELQPIIVDDADGAAFVTVSVSPSGLSGNGRVTSRNHFSKANDTFDDPSVFLPGSTTAQDPTSDSGYSIPRTYRGTIRFAKDLVNEGEYHAYAFWYDRSSLNATNTRIEVEYWDGGATRKRYLEVNQKNFARQRFSFLGTFDYKKDNTGKVPAAIVVTNVDETNTIVSDGNIMADAVAWIAVPKKPAGTVCAGLDVYLCRQPLCPEGDCFAPMSADDPSSKMFQAKQAMFEVLSRIDDVHFGFGSYEQDNARVRFKHWVYRVKEGQAPIYLFEDGSPVRTYPFPTAGSVDVFGTGPVYSSAGLAGEGNNGFHCSSGPVAITDTGNASFEDENFIGCATSFPADIRDLWEMTRLRMIPKLGKVAGQETSLYIRAWDGSAFKIYRIDWETHGVNYDLGDPQITVEMDVTWCRNIGSDPTCSSGDPTKAIKFVEDALVEYELVSDTLPYHLDIGRFPMRGNGYFNLQFGLDADRTCNGLEENDDLDDALALYGPFTSTTDDDANDSGYAWKRPWKQDVRGSKDPLGAPITPRKTYFDTGDFVPLDWSEDVTNKDLVQSFFAPNTTRHPEISPGYEPDYRIATYFMDRTFSTDNPSSYNRFLRLKDDYVKLTSNADADTDIFGASSIAEDQKNRPLIAFGSTPIYNSVRNFKDWYFEWKKWGSVIDVDWQCRPKYLLFLTDGDETCSTGSPLPICSTGNDIQVLSGLSADDKVKTYVVGFGLPGGGDALTCMAKDGKTGPNNTAGVPLLPNNKDELVTALTNIFNQIRTESFAFASASIPAVQSTAADKIYLSSFTPLPAAAVWPGRLDAFRQPLPLNSEGKPDIAWECIDGGTVRESGCHLWDAAERVYRQAPTLAQAYSSPPDLKLGPSFKTQRRVLYAQANPTGQRGQLLRLLTPIDRDVYPADREDLKQVFLRSYEPSAGMTEDDVDLILLSVIRNSLVQKAATIPTGPNTNFSCTGGKVSQADAQFCKYVMGDIFHANPAVVIGPADFLLYKSDHCGKDPIPKGVPNNCTTNSHLDDRGYREYVARTIWRRRMLVAATNDGQLHFFDAGVYTRVRESPTSSKEVAVFTDGTGFELFSYAPRLTLPVIREQARDTKHIYSIDGSVTIQDVFIDPIGTTPTREQREWRTVMVGGLREAGDVFSQTTDVGDIAGGYYALDVTQPDRFAVEADGGPPRFPIDKDLEVPTCLNVNYGSDNKQVPVSDCKTMAGDVTPFPLELWTFQDKLRVGGKEYTLNEDGLGTRDLGPSWSQAVVGQIAICKKGGTKCDYSDVQNNSAADLETRWVAIFGGGYENDPSPAVKANPGKGNWLFMVDVETGETLYKRRLTGAAPSDPAVLDTDQDGIFDAIYIGTTAGLLYKVNLKALTAGGSVPAIEDYFIPKSRIPDWDRAELGWTVDRITNSAWDPFVILETFDTTDSDPAAIFYPPAMFKIPELNYYGGLLLVGERENLWSPPIKPGYEDPYKGRVYVFVDENFTATTPTLPVRRADLEKIYFRDLAVPSSTDYLLDTPAPGKKRGWYLETPNVWRATGEPFLVAGIAIFSLFDPQTKPELSGTDKVCRRQGNTRGFALFLKNGNPLITSPAPTFDCETVDDVCCGGRCFKIDEFTTAIHTTSTVTKNKPPEKRTDGGKYFGDKELVVNDAQAAMLDAIRDAIMDSMPSSCQYNEKYEVSFAVLRNSTGLNELARVPMMICPGDWKN